MKILVTVGTTRFDSLVEYVDRHSDFAAHDIQFQIADGTYVPRNHHYSRFIDNIAEHYRESDAVITHAGAGTIYRLLEMGKRFIVVPNLERIDRHQLDIADFIQKNKYALVAYRLHQLPVFVDMIMNVRFNAFQRESFFKSAEILDYLLDAAK